MSQSVLNISKDILLKNISVIRSNSPNSLFCLPVKANAYGHGLNEVINITEKVVDFYAVSNINEAAKVNYLTEGKPILIFGAINYANFTTNHKSNFRYSVQSLEDVQKLSKIKIKDIKVHVKINTGLNRIGINLDDFKECITACIDLKNIYLEGVYSHLACADEIKNSFNNFQVEKFIQIFKFVSKINKNIICHLSNSYAFIGKGVPNFDMVRAGIISYGYLPSFETDNKFKDIRPVSSLTSKVVSILKLSNGFLGVGYSHKYVGSEGEYIANIPLGYGDGYSRALAGATVVSIHGIYYPVVSISMDCMLVSLGYNTHGINLGDDVEIISRNTSAKNSITNIAAILGTIEYEVITSIRGRVIKRII